MVMAMKTGEFFWVMLFGVVIAGSSYGCAMLMRDIVWAWRNWRQR